ncbi:IS110 family transposase [Marichromatium sp. PS1]|uniref:IS110 family transposase n=1 Tax=Marichromatium sp. PS1 TaxID=3138932 RepID=UPI0034E8B0DB
MMYLGIDVSKAKLHTALELSEQERVKLKTKTVPNTAAGVEALIDWLGRQGARPEAVHVVLEATGPYHETAAELLHGRGLTVSIVNPAQARDFARGLAVRTKTDAVDAKVLARFGALLKPAPWTPPSPEVRALRALLARQRALIEDLRRERNRLEKVEATHTPALVRDSVRESIAFLEEALAKLQQQIDDHLDGHPQLREDVDLLTSIPAIGLKVAQRFVALLQSRPFTSAQQFAAYLGLVPVERQSGTSVQGRPRLSKAGPAHARATLYMAAVTAIRYNPHVKDLYERLLARGKPKMVALGAAMRKLAHICFGVFKNRRPYQPDYASAA